mmetsp:Transcript_1537/g.3438  ORF Transcript_1537/g.3438 Transcript_1537/m.3438 type:complete len:224 (-) Transcript_1537:1518-2189(-)
MKDFLMLDYLQRGTPRQQLAYRDLTEELCLAAPASVTDNHDNPTNLLRNEHNSPGKNKNFVPSPLIAFRPVLAGTIPLCIDIEGKSDLDILCQVNLSSSSHNFDALETLLRREYSSFPNFSVQRGVVRGEPYLLAEFRTAHFPVEIFGQAVPVEQQHAYRHMIIEYELLQRHGETFRKQIIDLKRAGVKTEPAFCQALGLVCDDPYEALLQLNLSPQVPKQQE